MATGNAKQGVKLLNSKALQSKFAGQLLTGLLGAMPNGHTWRLGSNALSASAWAQGVCTPHYTGRASNPLQVAFRVTQKGTVTLLVSWANGGYVPKPFAPGATLPGCQAWQKQPFTQQGSYNITTLQMGTNGQPCPKAIKAVQAGLLKALAVPIAPGSKTTYLSPAS